MAQLLISNNDLYNRELSVASKKTLQDDSRNHRSLSMKGSFTFTIGRDEAEVKSDKPKVMEQGLDDEMLLTQLALDDKEIVIYDIASAIYLGERSRVAPLHKFKCFLDAAAGHFFVELSDKSPFENLTKSTFLKILDIAESIGAKQVFVCIHNKTAEIGAKIQTLLFVGFKKLIGEEARRVSHTRTHTLLSYDLEE